MTIRRRILCSLLNAIILCKTVNGFSIQSRVHTMSTSGVALRSRGHYAHAAMTSTSDTTLVDDTSNNSNKGGMKNTLTIVCEYLPLQRRHERVLCAFYLLAGLALSRSLRGDTLLAQSTIALVWMTFSLAISFMEAWVKFKAPLLRKYVAVDVGRHVFAAQHAVELGLATSFWISASRGVTTPAVYTPAIVSTSGYLVLAFFVGPLLYFRAKYKMVNEALSEHLTTDEKEKLDDIAKEIDGKPLPDARWHVIYVFLDAIKVVGLGLFARRCLLLRAR